MTSTRQKAGPEGVVEGSCVLDLALGASRVRIQALTFPHWTILDKLPTLSFLHSVSLSMKWSDVSTSSGGFHWRGAHRVAVAALVTAILLNVRTRRNLKGFWELTLEPAEMPDVAKPHSKGWSLHPSHDIFQRAKRSLLIYHPESESLTLN